MTRNTMTADQARQAIERDDRSLVSNCLESDGIYKGLFSEADLQRVRDLGGIAAMATELRLMIFAIGRAARDRAATAASYYRQWVEANRRWETLCRKAAEAELAGNHGAKARLEAAARKAHGEIVALARSEQ